ncbi:uncharacterized protein LOC106665595 [Cimex lectularius]|uniref:Pleiotrophin/Midkine C-terminal domain-containing protein n=1 Tax=Cimex lectularius TaxID=79782 RepID=A0A8I6SEW7_CIMLE|nr:uncharacterized protein LOC106665595 [Cimex lectularius]
MKCRCLVLLAVVLLATLVLAEGEIWEEDEKEVLIRSERGAKNGKEPCRYEKGPWSECDQKSNMRARQLTLKKKADGSTYPNCEETKTIQKKCKKACRYEKGTWSTCNPQNEMVRTDTLKEKSDPSCEQKRITTKKCKNKAGRPNKANKVSGSRRNRQ